jgi:hypothetical protein
MDFVYMISIAFLCFGFSIFVSACVAVVKLRMQPGLGCPCCEERKSTIPNMIRKVRLDVHRTAG